MITTISSQLIAQIRSHIHREQHIDIDSASLQINELKQTIERYDTAGFTARATNTRPILEQAHQQLKIAQLRDAGYLIIDLPKWNGYYQRSDMGKYRFLGTKPSTFHQRFRGFHYIPGKILKHGPAPISIICLLLCSQRKTCPKSDFTALWMVQTKNFTSPIPDFVIERVLEEQETFDRFDILFIAKKSELRKLVRDFDTVIDPILIGRWAVEERYDFNTREVVPVPSEQHAAVLAMWGDDLEEIDLALALSQSDGVVRGGH